MATVEGTSGRAVGRRGWGLLLGAACAALAVAAGLWRGARSGGPAPPELPLATFEPEVAALLGELRGEVLRDPGSGKAWGRLGKALLAHGVEPEAEACFAEAERLHPGEPRWPYLRGVCLREYDPCAAVGHFRRAAGRGGPAGLRFLLAEVLAAQGRLDEVRAEADALEADVPSHPRLRYLRGVLAAGRGDWRGCVELLTPLARLPETRRQATLLLATAHRRLGDDARAAELAQKAHALPPDSPWDDPYADECLTLARGRSRKFAEVQELKARHASEAEARALIKIIEETRGKDDKAFALLAASMARAGRIELSERAAREALAVNPDSRPALFSLCSTLLNRAESSRRATGRYGQADLELLREVERLAGRGLGRNGNDAGLLVLRGQAVLGLGRRDAALADLRAAALCRPDMIAAQYYLGEALLEAGLHREAREALTRARALAPEDETTERALRRLAEAEKKP